MSRETNVFGRVTLWAGCDQSTAVAYGQDLPLRIKVQMTGKRPFRDAADTSHSVHGQTDSTHVAVATIGHSFHPQTRQLREHEAARLLIHISVLNLY